MIKEIPEDKLIESILKNATYYGPLIKRLDRFASRSWFMKMRSLSQSVTFDDIRKYCDKAVYKTFVHDVFKQIVHEYIVNTRTSVDKHWFHLPSNSVAAINVTDVKVTPTYAEFATDGKPFRFTFPDRITYEWKDHSVVPSEISKVRFDMKGKADISETLSKLENIRRQLEATNRYPQVREFLFGAPVDGIEDLAGVDLTITVPKDFPLSHSALRPIPVSRTQVEQTVAQMFSNKLSYN